MNPIWATSQFSKSGKAHLWRESANEPRIVLSECGRVGMANDLQAEKEATGRCKKCNHDLQFAAEHTVSKEK